jgi:predicted nucleic acid-binding protein
MNGGRPLAVPQRCPEAFPPKKQFEGGEMPSQPGPFRCYWDACVFVSLIEGTPDRIATIKTIVEECERGEIEIYTSVVTITEVAYAKVEKDGKALDAAIERKISALWEPKSPFKLIEAYATLMGDAKALMRNSIAAGKSLKPLDAIHLATAQRIGAQSVHTYDDKLPAYAKTIGLKIERPRTDCIVFPEPQ